MGIVDNFILRLKRADTPGFARLKTFVKGVSHFRLPLPLPWIWLIEAIYLARSGLSVIWMRLCVVFYREPLFRRRCTSVGTDLSLEQLPSIGGHVRITVGNNVTISGVLSISCSRVVDDPELIIGSRVFIGHHVVLHPNRRIVIEDGALIAGGCFITDSNEHPLDMERRLRGEPCRSDEIRPVSIGKGAWLGKGCTVLRGVQIGEGAIVGAGSVVNTDIPSFAIANGNPAKVVRYLTKETNTHSLSTTVETYLGTSGGSRTFQESIE